MRASFVFVNKTEKSFRPDTKQLISYGKPYIEYYSMSDEPDYSSLPLEEKLEHKLWKVRLQAYEEITKQCQNSRNDLDECFQKFNTKPEIFKQAVVDANVVAQESGIQALSSYLEFGGSASNAHKLKSSGVVASLCEKGLSSSRAGTKAKANNCLLWFIELSEDPNNVVEDILPFLKHRLPKLVAACVSALHIIVENFGCHSVVSPKLIIPSLGKLFAHADRNVRAETTKLTVELYKWMGGALETVLFPDLKPVQQKDLAKAFELLQNITPEQKRFTRNQQIEISRRKEEESRMEAAGNEDVEMKDAQDDKSEGLQFDPFDLIEPVEVLSKLPSNLNSRISSTKWKDRKEALEEVHTVLEKAVKLSTKDDYLELVRIFAKCMKDANIQVVQLAANCIEFLAKGLKSDFQRYQSIVLGPMIERTKEKKASVADALNNAMFSIFTSSSLSDILDETLAGMKHKTPQVKIASTNFLQKCLAATKVPPKTSEIESIMESGVKLLTDSQEPVRQASTEMIGTLMKITGERELNAFLEKVDDNRRTKVTKFYEEVEVNSKLGTTHASSDPKNIPLSQDGGIGKSTRPRTSISSNPATGTKKLSLLSGTTLKKSSLDQQSSSIIPSKRLATSPAKRSDEASKVSSIGRGLTGRPLTSNTPSISAAATAKPVNSLSFKEKEELQSLRREKQQWLEKQEQVLKAHERVNEENINFTQEIAQLKSKFENILKDHTNALLMVKQKETQILRSNSDLENAKLKIRDLEQTIEMMKLQQNSYTGQQLTQPAKHSYNSAFTSSSTSPFETKQRYQPSEAPPTESRISSGELSTRVNRLSIDGNPLIETPGNSYSSNSYNRFSSPQKMADNTNVYTSSLTKDSMLNTNDDSWRRAAEVTSQLKARIEKMKARSRSGMSNFS